VLVPSVELGDKAMGAEIEAEGTRAVSVEDKDVFPVLVPSVEPEDKAMGAEIEAEGIRTASVEDKGVSAILVSNLEPEDKTMGTIVEAEDDITVQEVAEAYCVKCRQKQAIQGAREVTTKKGRPAIEGTCSVCGTKVFRFIARGKEN
jgi:hypothetical protein